jgi:hypothetical protein
MSTWISTLPGA